MFATALVVVGFFQILLDLTVEESLTKYGFRYVAGRTGDGCGGCSGRRCILKIVGGALATIIVVALAPFADELFGSEGVEQALLAAALLPFVQSSENVASTVLLLHSRYDLRGVYQAGSGALRLLAIVIAAPLGVTEALLAIVVAQGIATGAISIVGLVALRRFPAAPARELAEDVPGIRSFVIESSIATGVISLRTTLSRSCWVSWRGRPRSGSSASPHAADRPRGGELARPARAHDRADARLGEGRAARILAGSPYTRWAGAIMLVAVPAFFVAMPWLVDLVFGSEYDDAVTAARIVLLAAAVHFVLGWTKSLPVTIGRPRLRIWTHGLETLVAIPLVAVLGAEWGATGAAIAVSSRRSSSRPPGAS